MYRRYSAQAVLLCSAYSETGIDRVADLLLELAPAPGTRDGRILLAKPGSEGGCPLVKPFVQIALHLFQQVGGAAPRKQRIGPFRRSRKTIFFHGLIRINKTFYMPGRAVLGISSHK